MIKEGSRVTFKSIFCPKKPATVIVASAITRAIVPASVDSNPPLYVPRDSLDDITLDSNDKFTPAKNNFSKREQKFWSWKRFWVKPKLRLSFRGTCINLITSRTQESHKSFDLENDFGLNEAKIKFWGKHINFFFTFKNFSRDKHDKSGENVLWHSVRDYYMEAEKYSGTNHNLWRQQNLPVIRESHFQVTRQAKKKKHEFTNIYAWNLYRSSNMLLI